MQEKQRKKEMEKLQMQVMNGQIIQLLPTLKALKMLVDAMDRGCLTFEAKLLQACCKHSSPTTASVPLHCARPSPPSV